MVSTSLVCLFLALTASGAAGEQSDAAVQKVIQMLADMSATAKKEKQAEEVGFASFKTWCAEESANLRNAISKNKENIEGLGAEITQLTSTVSTLGENIGKLNADVDQYEADKKAATAQREADHAAFLKESADFAESVDALDRAIAVLQKQDYDRSAASAALLQVTANNRVPEEAKSIIAAFIGMKSNDADPDLMAYDAPEANAYEFQSGGIIAMLKKLSADFSAKLGDCQKEEMNSKHAYEMIKQDLTDSAEYATKDASEKSMKKDRKAEHAAQDKKQLGATIEMKNANEQTLSDMDTECAEKKLSFGEKQKLRADEIEALSQAIEILKSPEVSGSAAKHLTIDLAQAKARTAAALVQLDSDRTDQRSAGIRRQVRELLAEAGKRLHSQRLQLLAQTAATGPFDKVKKLIDSMITRLLEEAHADADHEGFCDTEMGKSKITRNKLSEEIDGFSAAADEGRATIMSLTDDIAQLTKNVADLDTATAEATQQRMAEKSTNAATVADAKAGQQAVAAATAVLKEFYKTALSATGFLQLGSARWAPSDGLGGSVKMGSDEWSQLANPNFEGTVDKGHKAGMQTFGETYSGQQDQAGGVLALLEVIQSDFATLQVDTEAAEAASQKEYDGFMVEAKRNKAVAARKIEMNSADKAAAESRLREDVADMKSTQDQLLASDRYHAKLVPQCIDPGQTYDERTAARASEITSLKEALAILSSEDIATSA